jgi:hypothetical protein
MLADISGVAGITDTKERKKLSSFFGGVSSLGVIGEAYPYSQYFEAG